MKQLLAGKNGEHQAARYLKKHGYKIVCMNYRSRFGEIDIIARKADVVSFVEVKLRKNPDFAPAYAAVTRDKQEKIRATALIWMGQNDCDLQMCFDIIEIYTDTKEINHIENAFC